MVLSIFFSEASIKINCLFFNVVVFILTLNLRVFIYSIYKPFIKYMLYKYFLTIPGSSFHSLNSVFQREEAINFDEVQGKTVLSALSNAHVL